MSRTVATKPGQFKHLFERVVDFVVAPCYNSYMRSIEQAFEGTERTRSMTSPAPSSPARVTAPLRLTRRGRVVLTLVLMVGLLVAGFSLGRGSSQAATHTPHARHTVTVQAGDTLWSVAQRVAPHADTRAVVAEIQSLNRIHDAVVVPGERLVVPIIG
jgi:Tfp pilus assembly protein FimV